MYHPWHNVSLTLVGYVGLLSKYIWTVLIEGLAAVHPIVACTFADNTSEVLYKAAISENPLYDIYPVPDAYSGSYNEFTLNT